MKIGSLYDSRPLAALKVGYQQPSRAERENRIYDGVDSSKKSREQLGKKADELLRLEQESSAVYNRKDFVTRSDSKKESNKVQSRDELISEIKDRVESGYYDNPEVIDKVVDKLTDEFND